MLLRPPFFDNEMGDLYVEGMTLHASLDSDFQGAFILEAPVAASTSTLLAATAFVDGQVRDVDVLIDPVGFGRTVQVTSTDAGDAILYGVDYLNQRMSQRVTCTAGTVQTIKAFKRIDRIQSIGVTGNISLGPGAVFGLPFTTVAIVREVVDGVISTVGTLVAPVTTTPTNLTGDVRGRYTPNATLDGVKDLVITFAATNQLLGGLYGQPQA
jgi:hypothetical protein